MQFRCHVCGELWRPGHPHPLKTLKSIDKAPAGGIMDFAHHVTGKDDWRVYERELGTSPEQVRDQEERVHQKAGDLAQASCDAHHSMEPPIAGDTVSLHSHNSEDSDQDAIHREAARLALGRSK